MSTAEISIETVLSVSSREKGSELLAYPHKLDLNLKRGAEKTSSTNYGTSAII